MAASRDYRRCNRTCYLSYDAPNPAFQSLSRDYRCCNTVQRNWQDEINRLVSIAQSRLPLLQPTSMPMITIRWWSFNRSVAITVAATGCGQQHGRYCAGCFNRSVAITVAATPLEEAVEMLQDCFNRSVAITVAATCNPRQRTQHGDLGGFNRSVAITVAATSTACQSPFRAAVSIAQSRLPLLQPSSNKQRTQ